ncbi:uncharacterized protein B0I36DRAFT_365614 [Microdochium trichocladiopsis]|uniref:DUF6590 domain-containing protein n=1 Tax=Microdochium trichocladiopsis TaxID=1682393 RepID=A0A9P8Y0V6_9PEZI|nr:uncharacterized protein B0I36DRAFT_365614 [Microdochium trichocladiopsis]KAH7025981.1 hypothetical protein B0I36DRAFT_365614 [Microdochium trichocladiopsis]
MGNQEDSTSKSDSGYGDDAASLSAQDANQNQNHPLTRRGYDVATAATLQVGDVFEFLWADAHEYQWEWKCLGYVRFIVLRHTDTFPHYAACIPISVGGKGMNDFTKPGIDHLQQGFVFADGERNPGVRQPRGGTPLPYSPIGIELKPGKLRVSHDSRANYADIVEVDHDAEIMVVGTVTRYFDRLRRNVNRAVMRQILRRSLEEYCERKARGSTLDLRSKTIEANPARFVSPEGIVEERSEDELPYEEPLSQDDAAAATTDHKKTKRHDEAIAGLEEQRERPDSEANDVLEDSDEFDGRQKQHDHQYRHGHTRRVSRTSRSSRHSREVLPLEEEPEKSGVSRPNWFRRLSQRLSKDEEKDREYHQEWTNYVTRPSHRRSTSLETQTGLGISSSRQSSPRRRPRRRPTDEAEESRISSDPRSMIDLAVAGRRRPNSSGE